MNSICNFNSIIKKYDFKALLGMQILELICEDFQIKSD